MTAQRRKKVFSGMTRILLVNGLLLSGVTIAYSQSVSDVAKAANEIAQASAENPLLAVIKILVIAFIFVIGLAGWFGNIIVKQGTALTEIATTIKGSPCVLIHQNPALFSKILDEAKKLQ